MAVVIKTTDRIVMHCRICGKTLAPEEVARELDEHVFCDACVESDAYMRYLAVEHAKNKNDMIQLITPQKPRNAHVWLLICGAAIIFAQITVLMFFMPQLPVNRHTAVEGPRVAMVNDLDVCLEQMWFQVKALEEYKMDRGAYPTSLNALVPKYLSEPHKHPATQARYIYRREGDYYLLEMPNPEFHNIKALTCDGRGGPPHIWMEDGR